MVGTHKLLVIYENFDKNKDNLRIIFPGLKITSPTISTGVIRDKDRAIMIQAYNANIRGLEDTVKSAIKSATVVLYLDNPENENALYRKNITDIVKNHKNVLILKPDASSDRFDLYEFKQNKPLGAPAHTFSKSSLSDDITKIIKNKLKQALRS